MMDPKKVWGVVLSIATYPGERQQTTRTGGCVIVVEQGGNNSSWI